MKVNGKTVKVACIDYALADELTFTLQPAEQATEQTSIDLIINNPTSSLKSIYWYDFENSWGIPLSFTFTVWGTDEQVIWDKLNWSAYMDNLVFFEKKRVNTQINIEPGASFTRTLNVWWPGMKPGKYYLTLNYGRLDAEIASNKLAITIK